MVHYLNHRTTFSQGLLADLILDRMDKRGNQHHPLSHGADALLLIGFGLGGIPFAAHMHGKHWLAQ